MSQTGVCEIHDREMTTVESRELTAIEGGGTCITMCWAYEVKDGEGCWGIRIY